jgi:hypothetical protein
VVAAAAAAPDIPAMILPTDFWVQALIRRAHLAGGYATVVRRGDARAGAVLVKAYDRRDRTARLYAEAFRGDGERVWMEPLGSTEEAALDAYAQRAVQRDPDLWVIEVEDGEGRHFLTEPVEPAPGAPR